MSWTDKQKQIAVRACQAIKMSKEHRELILRQLHGHAEHNGRTTSTSPRLTNADFDQFMAIVERAGGGQIMTRKRKNGPLLYPVGHWQRNADNGPVNRAVWKAQRIASTLIADGNDPKLGGIVRRNTGGRTEKLADCNLTELINIITALTEKAKQHGLAAANTDVAGRPVAIL